MANIFGKLFEWDTTSKDENGNVLMPVNSPVAGASGGGSGGASGIAGNIVFAGNVPTTSYTTVGASAASWSNVYTTATNWTTSFSDDLVISRPNKEPIKVAETLEKIMERLAILQPNFEHMEQFPALKAAYDNYKLIEALCHEDETKDED